MNNRFGLVAVIMTILVGVILIGTLLAPTITSTQHAQDKTYTNEGRLGTLYEFDEDSEDVTVITVSQADEHSVTINGVTHNIGAYQPVIVSDAFTIRFYNTSLAFSTPYEGNKTLTSATISISEGVATFTELIKPDATELEVNPLPISWAFIYDGSGTWMINNAENGLTVYSEKNKIYASNWISTTSEYFAIYNGVVSLIAGDGTVTNTELNWGGEYQNNGVYKMTLSSTSDDYTFTVDNSGTDYTVHPWFVCYPATVVGTPDDLENINALYGVVVVLFIVVLFVVAVRSLITRERD